MSADAADPPSIMGVEFYSDLFFNGPMAMAALDDAYVIRTANIAFLRLTAGDVVGVDCKRLFPAHRELQFDAAKALLESVGGFKGDLLMQTLGGATIAVEAIWFRHSAVGGQSVLYIQDVADRIQNQERTFSQLDRWGLAIGAANDGIWDWDLLTDNIECSDRLLEQLHAVDAKVIAPKSVWLARVHEADEPLLDDAIARHLSGESPSLEIELRVKRDDNQWIWALIRGKAARDVTGKPYRMAGSLSDVTAARQAMEEQAKYRHLVETCDDAIGIADMNGNFLAGNAALQRRALSAKQGTPIEEIFRPIDQASIRNAIQTLGDSGAWRGEAELDGPHGWPARVSIFAIRSPHYSTSNCIGFVFYDLTEVREAEWIAREQQAALAHAQRLASQGELVAGVAHELNQPLGAISNYAAGCLSFLNRPDASPQAIRQVMELMVEQSQLAGEIIRQIRRYVTKSRGDSEIVNVDSAVAEALSVIAHRIRRDAVQCDVSRADPPPEVKGNGVQIVQIVLNIVINALDAMRDSPRTDRLLKISTEHSEHGVLLTIADSGPGVSTETAPKIFEKFETTKGPDGLGLGLNIARSLAQAHGGKIWLKQIGGPGASFCVWLPDAAGSPH